MMQTDLYLLKNSLKFQEETTINFQPKEKNLYKQLLNREKKSIKELKESKRKITDEDLIETYQDYRNSFQDLYEEIENKLIECGID